ncbi:hypothetical protein ACH414_05405 [Streptomyces sp. NPDC020422]|uniref:hypothetical protein n=1 Tax=Streptomyces sp. NPDC020422 TaxID=3365074 RepID=UPI0037A9CE57
MAIAARIPALLRERSFRRYWAGQTVSSVGDQISLMALPLAAVVVLGADAAEMGWLKTAELPRCCSTCPWAHGPTGRPGGGAP